MFKISIISKSGLAQSNQSMLSCHSEYPRSPRRGRDERGVVSPGGPDSYSWPDTPQPPRRALLALKYRPGPGLVREASNNTLIIITFKKKHCLSKKEYTI
ncbi:hypothetical protein J6590_060865 [Homalodisca vitripennis]|nr:hypothetical protein J6590_060865 [Homalodisca vitripennis]